MLKGERIKRDKEMYICYWRAHVLCITHPHLQLLLVILFSFSLKDKKVMVNQIVFKIYPHVHIFEVYEREREM